MCLAIPSKIIDIRDTLATVDVEGVRREISLLLLENAAVGDYVIVHAGFAISRMDPEAAHASIETLREMAAAMDKLPGIDDH